MLPRPLPSIITGITAATSRGVFAGTDGRSRATYQVVFTKVPDTGSTYFKPVLRVSKGPNPTPSTRHDSLGDKQKAHKEPVVPTRVLG